MTLEAVERKIPINSYAYNQIGVNSKNVLEKAESLVGKAQKYWDIRMADAIIVGFKELEDGFIEGLRSKIIEEMSGESYSYMNE